MLIGQRQRGGVGEARGFGRAFALAIGYSMIGTHTYVLLPGGWSVHGVVPLELCDLAWPVAIWALWTRGGRAFAVLYYWGLTLSVQALLTPTLTGADYPGIRYLDYFGEHLLIVWAAVYLTWGLGMRPDWGGYRFAVAATAVWAVTAFLVNLIAGTDFGYLNSKPDTGSVLDLLGPWPWYLLGEVVIILGGWALITWPWVRWRSRLPGEVAGGGVRGGRARLQGGFLGGADVFGFPATRAEAAAGWRVRGAGDVALQEDAAAVVSLGGVGDGDRREEGLGVGVAWVFVDLVVGAYFYDLAQIHHCDSVADVADYGQVVGYEDVGQVELVLEFGEQVDDLGLD